MKNVIDNQDESETREREVFRVIELARRKVNEFFDELESEFASGVDVDETALALASLRTPEVSDRSGWSLDPAPLAGSWQEIETLEGQTYGWPDGNIDEYTRLVRFAGRGDYEGMELGIGFKENGERIGFVFSNGSKSKRGLTYFQVTDDFAKSGELISMIRGGGSTGHAGFSPADEVPAAYAGFKVDSLKNRKEGKWNVLGVVAGTDDLDSMLNHTALQARLRGI